MLDQSSSPRREEHLQQHCTDESRKSLQSSTLAAKDFKKGQMELCWEVSCSVGTLGVCGGRL